VADASTSPPRSPLVRVLDESDNQRVEMQCPKCEAWQDILAYKNLNIGAKYAHALNAIVKCVRCKHLFSPRWLQHDD
jgi:hypothetical protein